MAVCGICGGDGRDVSWIGAVGAVAQALDTGPVSAPVDRAQLGDDPPGPRRTVLRAGRPLALVIRVSSEEVVFVVNLREDGEVVVSNDLPHPDAVDMTITAPGCCLASLLFGELRLGVLVAEGCVNPFRIGVASVMTAVLSREARRVRPVTASTGAQLDGT